MDANRPEAEALESDGLRLAEDLTAALLGFMSKHGLDTR